MFFFIMLFATSVINNNSYAMEKKLNIYNNDLKGINRLCNKQKDLSSRYVLQILDEYKRANIIDREKMLKEYEEIASAKTKYSNKRKLNFDLYNNYNFYINDNYYESSSSKMSSNLQAFEIVKHMKQIDAESKEDYINDIFGNIETEECDEFDDRKYKINNIPSLVFKSSILFNKNANCYKKQCSDILNNISHVYNFKNHIHKHNKIYFIIMKSKKSNSNNIAKNKHKKLLED